ncbi:hypothetical protein P7C70_g5148, partial [Phenoliferia sp. Uapishka_3]
MLLLELPGWSTYPTNADPNPKPIRNTPTAQPRPIPPYLPPEILLQIIDYNSSPSTYNSAFLKSRFTELAAYSRVSRLWRACALPSLFTQILLPDPMRAWELTKAMDESWIVMRLVAERGDAAFFGRAPQDVEGAKGHWWETKTPKVSAHAFEESLGKLSPLKSVGLSGLENVELDELRSVGLQTLHLNSCYISHHRSWGPRLERLTYLHPREADLVETLLPYTSTSPLPTLVLLDIHPPLSYSLFDDRPIELPVVSLFYAVDQLREGPQSSWRLQGTKALRHLILSGRTDVAVDFKRRLDDLVPEDARLETLALDVGYTSYHLIQAALESSEALRYLERLRIGITALPTRKARLEKRARKNVLAICASRGIEVEERVYTVEEVEERKDWAYYTRSFAQTTPLKSFQWTTRPPSSLVDITEARGTSSSSLPIPSTPPSPMQWCYTLKRIERNPSRSPTTGYSIEKDFVESIHTTLAAANNAGFVYVQHELELGEERREGALNKQGYFEYGWKGKVETADDAEWVELRVERERLEGPTGLEAERKRAK